MGSKRSFYILLGVAVVMTVAAVLSQQRPDESTLTHGLYVPGLDRKVDTVQAVVLRTADELLRLERTEDGWVARSKDDYPANTARIRQLVLGISRLQRLEKKTRQPERFGRLELSSVEKPDSKAVQIALLNGDGEKLTSILLGKTHDFVASGRSRYFVRKTGEPRSWLVEGALPPVVKDLGKWLERKLLPGIEKTDIQSVRVIHAGGERVIIYRDSREQADFQLAELSGEEEIDNQYSVNTIADTFQGLSLQDVDAANAAGENPAIVTVDALTFDGLRVVARFSRTGSDYGVRLNASYEPEYDRAGGGSEGGDIDAENLARKLNKRWRNRLFVVPRYSVDALTVRRSDLIESAEESGAK
ncbi:MAG: hypothetical protein MAG794_01654 [Gammaproteobacteria bacterium]|nr:hypothetical protein [Gammaproteobacteria bacterium]